jgi:hypothetical protein
MRTADVAAFELVYCAAHGREALDAQVRTRTTAPRTLEYVPVKFIEQ